MCRGLSRSSSQLLWQQIDLNSLIVYVNNLKAKIYVGYIKKKYQRFMLFKIILLIRLWLYVWL